MNNIENIKLSEVKENELEDKSISLLNDADNFDDCELTDEERLALLKKEREELNFDDCIKEETEEEIEDYEDCRKL